MKYFLTGITGQLGVVMSEQLLNDGQEVVGMYRRAANSSFERLEEAGLLKNKRLTLCSGDLTDYSSIERIIQRHQPDVIINFGASSHVHESFETPIANLSITGGGCVNLLEAVRNNLSDRYCPQIVQMSSNEMFGSNFNYFAEYHHDNGIMTFVKNASIDNEVARKAFDCNPNHCWQDETTPFSANSPYAAAKIYAHNMCDLYRRAYDMQIYSMICFNMESPFRGLNFVTRKVTDYCAQLNEFLSKWKIGEGSVSYVNEDGMISAVNSEGQILRQIPKLQLGNLDAKRDWMDARDACRGILIALDHCPDDYVLCTSETHSIRDLCEVAFSAIEIENWEFYVDVNPKFYRPVEVPFLRGLDAKIRQKGWKPKTKFEDLIKRMVNKDVSRYRDQTKCDSAVCR